MFLEINKITDRNDRQNLTILFFLLLFSTFLEMLGLGAIPIFAMTIMDPKNLQDKFNFLYQSNFIIETSKKNLVFIMSIILIAIFLVKNAFIAFVNYYYGQLIKSIRGNLTNKLFEKYIYANYEFHIKKNSADLIRNIYSEVSKSVYYLTGLILILKEILILFMIFILLLISSVTIAFSIFALLGLFAIIFFFYTRHSSQLRGKLIQEFWGKQIRTLKHGMGSIKEIKILNKENFMIKLFNFNTNNIEKYNFVQSFIVTLPRLILETLTIIGICILSILYVLSDQPIENYIPLIALITVCAIRMMPSFNSIAQALSTIKYHTPSFKLIVGEIDEINKNINTDYFKKNNQNIKKIKFADKIKINNLSYKYPGNDSEKYVFKNLNLEINFGEVVGISGASGAGKSTLVDLLAGLLRPSEGKIIIDSIDINTHPSDWQRQIGYVPQDTYLVDDTIKSNIAFGVSTEKINNNDLNLAIESSQLKKLINSLPEKENSLVGEDGIKLSGGEKQRIGIARALYFRPKVLFLDEPTSSLDSKNEKLILEDIYKLGENRTILIISHRTKIFKYCKKILNIKDGKVEILYDYKELI